MSLSGLRPTRIDADRVISTFSFDPASSRAHRIPIEGNMLEGGLRKNRMPPEGLADPIIGNKTRFRLNVPVSELTKHVTRAIEANDANSTPPVARTADGATITKMSRPLTKPLLRMRARGKLDLQGDQTHGHRIVAKILRKGNV